MTVHFSQSDHHLLVSGATEVTTVEYDEGIPKTDRAGWSLAPGSYYVWDHSTAHKYKWDGAVLLCGWGDTKYNEISLPAEREIGEHIPECWSCGADRPLDLETGEWPPCKECGDARD